MFFNGSYLERNWIPKRVQQQYKTHNQPTEAIRRLPFFLSLLNVLLTTQVKRPTLTQTLRTVGHPGSTVRKYGIHKNTEAKRKTTKNMSCSVALFCVLFAVVHAQNFPANVTVPHHYPLYKQCNSSWGNDIMVTTTICKVRLFT